ncbi:MAG: hypothetical protein JRN56_01855 [Nitrososphaerota archaeon]|nr:hypothetical protein [Nitrososphaerota archaeon]MDG6903798.1 hypothetical protein [Nitrososphaerota archaeon]MDG6911568.1 hypothetical protein [Nitrososphaerota archaeon]MDG6940473.1 hypothetical protein [Nitrososphaerota archaeon]MDG6960783.1 hypothetical protein [Nitrososphaerota archaeon]
MTRGWIFDLYPGGPGEMVVWLKTENGEAVRLTDRWSPSLFVGSNSASDFAVPVHTLRDEFLWTRVVRKRETVTNYGWSDVLEAKLTDARNAQRVAERIERLGPFGTFRIYNVDVPPDQGYLYENDLFPLAFCNVMSDGGRLRWTIEDDVWAYDYAIPTLRTARLDVQVAKKGRLPKPTDQIESFTLEYDGESVAIVGQSETDKLFRLAEVVHEADPDVILTNDGDTFLFPYLIRRTEANSVRLSLDRDGAPLTLPSKPGTSYFSYGQVRYKPTATKLRGRVHIDVDASFTYSEGGFDALFELSRVCRMPLHTSSRASIGKALSSLQFYHALKADLLVPWKPTLAERFKDRNELMTADRGGLIFEQRVGAYEGVGELDFSALYPNIMYRKNISAETVRCSCCPDSDNRVPELGWNTCRQEGLVPRSIRIIVEKRLHYKEIKEKVVDDSLRDHYDARQAALKWLGVTTFGYLGFNNAKFGRIDAHIAVCAWDRKVITDAARVAEASGFVVVHGIVDSLWLWKEGAEKGDYLGLKAKLEAKTGFAMSFEGIYKWVAFLPSKSEPGLPALNRYFGAFEDGRLKVRGIEARRHDTPPAFVVCQKAILDILAEAGTVAEAKARVPECIEVFLRYAGALERHEIPASELTFSTNLSKAPEEYATATVQHAAVKQLVDEGADLHAGERIHYVIMDYLGRGSKRVTPLDMIENQSRYDSDRYVRLLAETCSSVLEPFDPGCAAEGLMARYEARRSRALTS